MEGRRRERSPKSALTHSRACKRDEIKAEDQLKGLRRGKSGMKTQRSTWKCGKVQDALGIEVSAMGSAEEVGNKLRSLLRWCYLPCTGMQDNRNTWSGVVDTPPWRWNNGRWGRFQEEEGGKGSLSRLPGRLERLGITKKYDSFGSEPRGYQQWIVEMMLVRCGVKSIWLGRRVGERGKTAKFIQSTAPMHVFTTW